MFLINPWLDFMHYLISGVRLSPRFYGEVYRGLTSYLVSVPSTQYIKGSYICWVALTSTSYVQANSETFILQGYHKKDLKTGKLNESGTLITIRPNHNGHMIEDFSLLPENEVLFLPNSVFRVVDVTTRQVTHLVSNKNKSFIQDVIVLEEIYGAELSDIIEVQKI